VNWDAIGATAEILSALVVGVTVIYLAFQTQSTRELVLRANMQTMLDAYGLFQSAIVGDKEIADIWNRGTLDLGLLDEVEKTRFTWLWLLYTNPVRVMWASGDRQEENYRTWAIILSRPGAKKMFNQDSNALPKELIDYLNTVIEDST
jgi:hypothetical protein